MKKVLIIINICKDKSTTLAEAISAYLKEKGYEVELFSFDGFNENKPFKKYDFVITLGGDGTVLYAARCCVGSSIPVFPVNLGEFGFLASIQPGQWQEKLELYLEGKAPVAERELLKATVIRDGKPIHTAIGMNDVVISAKRAARTISLDVQYDALHLCKLKSDGVIICTSTGSTAYSAAAGGPIIDPSVEAFVITPVNSFSLSSRPLVLSTKGKLSVAVKQSRTKEVSLTVDGQEPVCLLIDDVIEIEKLSQKVQLVCCTPENFYNALRSKLNWSGGPHA